MAQVGPAGNAVPGHPVLLFHREGGGALPDALLHLGVELLHDGGGGWLTPVAHHGGHIVEQLESADGGGLVIQQVVGPLP